MGCKTLPNLCVPHSTPDLVGPGTASPLRGAARVAGVACVCARARMSGCRILIDIPPHRRYLRRRFPQQEVPTIPREQGRTVYLCALWSCFPLARRACPLALLNPRIRQKVASSKLVCAEETEHELEVTLAPPTRNRPKARKSWPSPCTSVDSINGSRLCRCLASSFRLVDCFVANNAKVGDGH